MIELITGIKSFRFWVVLQLNQSVPGKTTLISQEYLCVKVKTASSLIISQEVDRVHMIIWGAVLEKKI